MDNKKLALDRNSERVRVQTAVCIYLLLFVVSLVWVWVWFVLHRHGKHDFPLGERVERFGDLVRFSSKYQIGKDPRIIDPDHLVGTLFPKNYPPFAVLIYLFLLQVCAPYAVFVLVGIFLVAVFGGCVMVWRRIGPSPGGSVVMCAAIFATGLLGWGTLQTAMRGNIEGWLWIVVCIGAWLFSRRFYVASGAAFGVAMCIKPHPVLWLILLASHKKYKAAAIGIATWVVGTLLSLLAIDRNPLRAYQRISGKSTFFDDYVASYRPILEMEGDHSLLQTMKTIARVVRNHGLHFSDWEYHLHSNNPGALKLYHAYLPLAALIGLGVLWQVWHRPLLNQIFALAVITLTLPTVSGDYTLSLLLVPLGFFAIFLGEDVATGNTPFSLGAILLILIPTVCLTATVPMGLLHGVFRCAALIALLTTTAVIPMPSTLFGEKTSGSVAGEIGARKASYH